MDRDLGYEIMRIDPHQKWHPVFLAQPIYNLILMGFFEWGVALHDLDLGALRKGEKPMLEYKQVAKGIAKKAAGQVIKDYVAFPALSGKYFKRALIGELHRQHRPQRVGALDHLLRPLPRPDLHVLARRGRPRGRGARATGTCASCSARPTSRARRSST